MCVQYCKSPTKGRIRAMRVNMLGHLGHLAPRCIYMRIALRRLHNKCSDPTFSKLPDEGVAWGAKADRQMLSVGSSLCSSRWLEFGLPNRSSLQGPAITVPRFATGAI